MAKNGLLKECPLCKKKWLVKLPYKPNAFFHKPEITEETHDFFGCMQCMKVMAIKREENLA